MLAKKNILLVDDNNIDLFITQSFLKKFCGADTIFTASSGLEALNTINSGINGFPEIIFLDIKMPEMDGFEFLNEFEKLSDERKTNCEIYMLSSSQDPSDVQKSYLNPFVKNFISKPISQDLLKSLFNK
jgi:CheY-like chemotaxis protein